MPSSISVWLALKAESMNTAYLKTCANNQREREQGGATTRGMGRDNSTSPTFNSLDTKQTFIAVVHLSVIYLTLYLFVVMPCQDLLANNHPPPALSLGAPPSLSVPLPPP